MGFNVLPRLGVALILMTGTVLADQAPSSGVEPSCICGSITTSPKDPYLAQARSFGMRVNPDLSGCTAITCPLANALMASLYYQASVRRDPEALKVLENRYVGASGRKPSDTALARYADKLYAEFRQRRPDLPTPEACQVVRSTDDPEMLYFGMPVVISVQPGIKNTADPKYAVRAENYRCMLMIQELQAATKR